MDRPLAEGPQAEARELLRVARAWIAEFAEEGVTSFSPAPAAPVELASATVASVDPAAVASDSPSLDQVREHLGDCTRCRLHEARQNLVLLEGR